MDRQAWRAVSAVGAPGLRLRTPPARFRIPPPARVGMMFCGGAGAGAVGSTGFASATTMGVSTATAGASGSGFASATGSGIGSGGAGSLGVGFGAGLAFGSVWTLVASCAAVGRTGLAMVGSWESDYLDEGLFSPVP